MIMNEAYIPIACSLHDEYEIAIMQKKVLSISWSDDDGLHTAKVQPKDILVKDKQEFLIADSRAYNELCLRLDKITLLDK